MLSYIKKVLQNEDYKRITNNILSLFSLQGINYILPLITFPYLTRVLGPDKYGLIAFSFAFIGYFQILTDYGFNLSATREISIYRKENEKISDIFNSVMATKLILLVISFLIMTFLILTFEKFRHEALLYFFTFGLVIGNLLMPSWFFQGVERMRYISLLNMAISIIFTISIFIFIRQASDYIYVPLINAIGTILIGIIALMIVRCEFNINFALPSFNNIKYQVQEGWHIFLSTIAISFYTTSNTFILGLFVSPTILGYYAVAENILKMIIGLLGPFTQSVYPYISSLAIKSQKKALGFIKKVSIIMAFFTFMLSITLFLIAGFVIHLLAGNQYDNSIILLQIMSLLPFIIGMSNVFGVLFLFAFGYSNKVSKIQLILGCLYPLILLPLTYRFLAEGTAFSFLIIETLITLSFWFIYKNIISNMDIEY